MKSQKNIIPNSIWEILLILLGTAGIYLLIYFLLTLLLLGINFSFWSELTSIGKIPIRKAIFVAIDLYILTMVMHILPLTNKAWNFFLFKISWIRDMMNSD
jgi:hypothetical protein